MNDSAFLAIFPFLFVGMWLFVTSILSLFAGWAALREQFPNRDEAPLKRLRFQSGLIGKGKMWNPWGNVNYGNCLQLDICPSGLRVAIWRFFGPFSPPFFVPWARIAVEEKRFLLWRFYRLSFAPDLSALTIRRRAFAKIVAFGFLQEPVGRA